MTIREQREHRTEEMNELLRVIASCGRKFFQHEGRIASFQLDKRSRVWFRDAYTEALIYTHGPRTWRKFTLGGTMQTLVVYMRKYIMTKERIPPGTFGPWPSWYCDGDLWGYGEDMEIVREAARPFLDYELILPKE